jgi:anti-sigma regulatory factor (Ser/Thr protein kinase)
MKTTLTADVNAPGQGRAYVASQLLAEPLPAGVLLDKVVLIASELVTNAVQAGATSIDLDVRTTSGRLDLIVTDDAEGWPTPTTAAAEDTAGRGLSIVEQLADAWDVTPQSRGKVVTASWFADRESADL